MKRTTAFFLSAVLLLGAAAPCMSAAAADAASEPTNIVLHAEKLGGVLGNLLGHVLKLITFTDESKRQSPAMPPGRRAANLCLPAKRSKRSPPRRGVRSSCSSRAKRPMPIPSATLRSICCCTETTDSIPFPVSGTAAAHGVFVSFAPLREHGSTKPSVPTRQTPRCTAERAPSNAPITAGIWTFISTDLSRPAAAKNI